MTEPPTRLKQPEHPVAVTESIPEVPEAIRCAKAAFLRDFPALLADRKTRGKYVCYWRDKRVAVGKDYRSVILEVVRLDIPEHEYIVEKVHPSSGFIEEEEIDRSRITCDEEPA